MPLYAMHNLPRRAQVMATFSIEEKIRRYDRELCYTKELIQTVYAQNDKENCVDCPGEAKMSIGFMSFRAP